MPFLSQFFSSSFHRTAATRLAAKSEAQVGAVMLLRSKNCWMGNTECGHRQLAGDIGAHSTHTAQHVCLLWGSNQVSFASAAPVRHVLCDREPLTHFHFPHYLMESNWKESYSDLGSIPGNRYRPAFCMSVQRGTVACLTTLSLTQTIQLRTGGWSVTNKLVRMRKEVLVVA
jgi:hypothetical protein